MAGLFQISNIRKTLNYMKRNGFRAAKNAALERIGASFGKKYRYEALSDFALREQIDLQSKYEITFSILVPAYETPEKYLRELIDSCLMQTYGRFELLIADASVSEQVKQVVESFKDSRIQYLRLSENGGISENTNAALARANGQYIALLDHDDLLTPDALYECAVCIEEHKERGQKLSLIYSDEDKCDETGKRFYDPNIKPKFNRDLILSNNYICHLLVLEADLFKELKLRKEYDGAQDHDLVLRVLDKLWDQQDFPYAHIPKVLYHWRCHESSTAQNPESKTYAYEAGKRAIEAFNASRGFKGAVSETKHKGFFRTKYEPSVFDNRREVAAVGGKIIDRHGQICGGGMDEEGRILFEGLKKNYAGPCNRADCRQEVYALDIRCIQCSAEGERILKEVLGVDYLTHPETGLFYCKGCLPDDANLFEYSLEFAKKVHEEGLRLLWDPEMSVRK